MKRILLVAAITAASICSLVVKTNFAQDSDQTAVQLVYHSDTRGYYRPCG